MEKENKKTIEIPFGAKDSELHEFEYTIPEGYEARIEDGKVIVKKKESEDERIRKELIFFLKEEIPQCSIKEHADKLKEFVSYLEKQKEQKPAEWSEKHVANIFEKVGLAKIAREQGNDKLTNALQDAMIELSKVETPEWSKEAEDMFESIIATCKLAAQDRESEPARHLFEMQERFLISLRKH